MKKLFEKDQIWFAVMWIVIYVLAFGNGDSLSEAIGVPKLLTLVLGLVIAFFLLGFIRKEKLEDYLGLCPVKKSARSFLYFIPLALMCSVNLWFGVTLNETLLTSILSVLCMCLVGLLEEVIFRGLLFRGMCKTGSAKVAIIVSSVTFGMGHAVNLLMGAPLLDTLLQLVYASAVGFAFTAIVYVGGSLWPCIIAHALVNSLSIFAVQPNNTWLIIVAIFQTVLSVSYGLWILKDQKIK